MPRGAGDPGAPSPPRGPADARRPSEHAAPALTERRSMPSRSRPTVAGEGQTAGARAPDSGAREKIHLEILRRTGAYRTGDHFLLPSGHHAPEFIDKALVTTEPSFTEGLGDVIAKHFAPWPADVVLSTGPGALSSPTVWRARSPPGPFSCTRQRDSPARAVRSGCPTSSRASSGRAARY